MRAELRIEMLGTLRITLDGQPVKFVRRRAEALLVYLVRSARVHTRDNLAMLLAGEIDDQRARKHLRNALSEVMAYVGDYLLVTPRTIAFDHSRPHWSDAAEFESIIAATEGAQRLEQANALYHDEFLAGFLLPDAPAFDDWLLLEREHLRNQLVQGLHSLLAQHLQRHDAAAGIACASKLLALEPWNEEAHRGLMRLLAHSGKRTAALAQYEVCRRELADELGVVPTPETTALYQQLRATPAAIPHNLPAPAMPLVGREAELAELRGRLADPRCRLISICGLSGSGKTRLALEAAATFTAPSAHLDEGAFSDGVYLVELGPTTTGTEDALAATVGHACGLDSQDARGRREQLLRWLATRTMLLVLDGGAGPLPEAALLRDILRYAPRVKLLITSPQRLCLQDEWSLELAGLPLPAGPDEVPQSPAGRLFLLRAQQVAPNRTITTDDYTAVAHICRLLDGLPLALIMAAQWLRSCTCAALLVEVATGLDALTATLQDLPERQRSMRAVLARAAEALADAERAMLRRLAVFTGTFDQETAQAFAAATPLQLLALRDSGLLALDEQGRYRLPQMVRRYAAEQLAARPYEEMQARARHAAHFAGVASQRSGSQANDHGAVETLHVAHADVLSAWRWATKQVVIELMPALGDSLARWYELTGHYQEWADEFADAAALASAALAAARTPEADLRAALGRIMASRARALQHLGRHDEARALLDEALVLANPGGGQPVQARGDLDTARRGITATQTMTLVATMQHNVVPDRAPAWDVAAVT